MARGSTAPVWPKRWKYCAISNRGANILVSAPGSNIFTSGVQIENANTQATSSRVQFLAQHLAQRADRYRPIVSQQRRAQGFVNQGLVTLAQRLATLLEAIA